MAPKYLLRIRPFANNDRAACLAVFDSNLPHAMTPEERGGFATDLGEAWLSYFVVENEAGEIIACGGFDLESTTLCWGMVHREYQRRGIGTFLLSERLRQIFELRGPCEVRLDTSQFGRAFFERQGFRVVRNQDDHYAPGIHRYDMVLKLEHLPVTIETRI